MADNERNVFRWLSEIRARPSMYLRSRTLSELETLIWGYCACLLTQRIIEPVPNMSWHFLDWFHYRTGWSCSTGWADAIEEHYPEPDKALAAFFAFVDEYRKLQPTVLCTVSLGPEHNPTGKRCGRDGLPDKPCQIDIVRYSPKRLHFLRCHYPDRIEDWSLLMTRARKLATTARFAKEWVHDEFGVEFAAWKRLPKNRS